MRILVTGATGFVGRSLVPYLAARPDFLVTAAVQRAAVVPGAIRSEVVGDIRVAGCWDHVDFVGVDAVVHLAGRAHVTRERSVNPLLEFRAVNVEPTIALFESCRKAGVKHFLFLSSIGVHGSCTMGTPLRESDSMDPTEPYAYSKLEAEQALQRRALGGDTSLTVIRPVLVYGANAPGNLLRLMRWIDRGWPVPTCRLPSRRSFLGLSALCELIALCLVKSAARGEVFVAADRQPLSTDELVGILAPQMGRSVRLLPLPSRLLFALAALTGKLAEVRRVVRSLEVDSSKACAMLGWDNGHNVQGDMQAMVRGFADAVSD